MLRDIPAEGLDLSFEMDPAALQLAEGNLGFGGTVHVELSVSRQEDMVFVTGRAVAGAILECVRCLKQFAYPLAVGIQAEYVAAAEAPGEEEHELGRQELDVMYYTGEAVPLDDLIREQILLGIPVYPLCAAGCLGLCQRCGRDLNTGQCQCRGAEGDPRFSILKDYFKKNNGR